MSCKNFRELEARMSPAARDRSDAKARKMIESPTMKSYVFKVVVEPDRFRNGREAWHASCPALEGCHTWGDTREEALANAREAAQLYVEDLIALGDSVPMEQGTRELPGPVVAVNV